MPEPANRVPTTPLFAWILLPLLALLATVPLLRQGCSCGHDISFHLESWLDAAQQLRHGTLYPAWDFNAAWNAGEPRFLFYPPLSWMLGEFLTLAFPFAAVPAIYTWLALSAASLSMFAVARRFVTPAAALVAATVYLANPYMLFTALERTAYAELMAAVWIPWLLLALLRSRPTIAGVAVPFALLWLTNAPAAVMGAYTLALLAALRIMLAWLRTRTRNEPLALARTYTAGALFGLALPAVYLLPAAYERRFVEITMALVPGLSYPANFLFGRTTDPAHDLVLFQASTVALTLLGLTCAVLIGLFLRRKRIPALLPSEPLILLAAATAAIAFLLEPISTPLWAHLPDLAFLQFPWRFLMVLAPVLALAVALLVNHPRAPSRAALTTLATAATILLAWPADRLFLQPCAPADSPAATAQLFRTGHGVAPTDEYTPNNADNDYLRSNSPAYWLAPDPDAFAPNTLPNPNAAAPNVDFGPPPPSQTRSTPAPRDLHLQLAAPGFVILNLRDFPNWTITRDGAAPPARTQRDDGLIALELPAGFTELHIRWRTGRDRILGALLSVISVIALALLTFARSRKISAEHAV